MRIGLASRSSRVFGDQYAGVAKVSRLIIGHVLDVLLPGNHG